MALLTQSLSSDFSVSTRTRGGDYFKRGRVKQLKVDPSGEISTIVSGSQEYDVLINIQRKKRSWTLLTYCTCPFMENYDGFCKHIWATLLAIDAQNALKSYGDPPPRIELDILEDDPLDEETVTDDWDDRNILDDLDDESDEDAPIDSGRYHRGESLRYQRLNVPDVQSEHRTSKKNRDDSMLAWRRMLQSLPPVYHTNTMPKRREAPSIEPLYIFELEDYRHRNCLVLSLAHCPTTPTGKSGKFRRLTLAPADVPRIASLADRLLCMILIGAGITDGYGGYYGYSGYAGRSASTKWYVTPELYHEVLPLLFDTGRVLWRLNRNAEPEPLTRDAGEPWELVLSALPANTASGFALRGRLRRNGEYRELTEIACYLRGNPGLFIHDGVLGLLETHDCHDWIPALGQNSLLPIRKKDRAALLAALSKRRVFPPLEWPDEWDLSEETDLAPIPELTLKIKDSAPYQRTQTEANVTFRYDDQEVSALENGALLVDLKKNRIIRRQRDHEEQLLSRLTSFGVKPTYYQDDFTVPIKRIPEMVSALLAEGWTVLGDRKLYRRPGNFKIDVSSGIDWFDVNGQIEFDGQSSSLPELLAALQKGEKFVRLGDGSLGMLPEQWLAKHRAWLELGQEEDGTIRFAKTQIGLIDALLAEMPEATFDEQLATAREKLHGFDGIRPRPEPKGFVGHLREYQREGLGWLCFLDEFGWGGCLADDMGLGKTVQLLALLVELRNADEKAPALVVAPKSVVFNWVREAERFTPGLRVLNYTGLERKNTRDEIERSELVLTTYGTLRRDIDFLRNREFGLAVLDEAQAIKNPDSLSAKAARLLRANRRLVMTGTPVENHLGDLWSLFEFLNPGMMGTVKAFKNLFSNGTSKSEAPANLALLQRMLRPFILRRTKAQAAPELPERSEQTIECELGAKQAAYYKELRDHYRMTLLARVEKVGLARSKIHVLEALLRLRQAACHPGLIDETKTGAESAKFESLLAMLDELLEEGHKALVFSQFTSLLALLRAELDRRGVAYEYLDGGTRQRSRCVDRFQADPNCRLFLISLKAGGTGLNLTAADYVFILDPWWNPAVEAQAIDRTHRIGQDKKVIAYRLIARGTVEDKILELQRSKRELAEAIITQRNSLIRELTRDDLALLLS